MTPLIQPNGTISTNSITSSSNPINDIVTLYSPLDFKTHIYNSSIDDTTIKQALYSVQSTQLQLILGISIYEDFINEFKLANYNHNLLTDGTMTIKGINYKELWNVALMYVIKATEYELMINLTYPLTPSGIKQQINNSTFGTEFSDFKFRFTNQIEVIEREKSKLMQYITDKITSTNEKQCDKMTFKRTYGLFRIGK